MSHRQLLQTKNEERWRVDALLGLLRDVPTHPSPEVRERLRGFASERLSQKTENAVFGRAVSSRWSGWLRGAIAPALLGMTGMIAVIVVHRDHRGLRAGGPASTARVAEAAPQNPRRGENAEQTSVAAGVKGRHLRSQNRREAGMRRMTMRLPYSNSAIETGTYGTIRVSMSQAELVSLGFPINNTVQDRRIVAELTLGDDGLPRAISLPLPIEVTKEEK